MKQLILFLFSISTFSLVHAQTVEDAIRYSNLNVGGTARTVGVGGAFGALGADFGAISINPAGLGMYRTSEFTITPTVFSASTEAELMTAESSTSETKSSFNINNVGLVVHSKSNRKNVVSSAFAIGYNRLANFSQQVTYSGETTGSFIDRFVEQSYGLGVGDLDDFENGLAYDTDAIFLFDPDDNTTWTNDYLEAPEGTLLFKRQKVATKGSLNELALSLGANYNERFMIGASVGIPFLTYEEEKIYEEDDRNNEIAIFNDFGIDETLETSGIGINVKLGMIYRINQTFRIGATIHSPTAMSLNDTYSNVIRYDAEINNGTIEASSPEGVFDYKLRTPWRAILSGAAIIGRSGFITADIEYVDFSNAKFNLTENLSSTDVSIFENQLNTEIQEELTSTINIRVGGEYALKKLRLRAGYGMNESYRQGSDLELSTYYTAGLGLRLKSFYADFAYKREGREEIYLPYNLVDQSVGQTVQKDINNNKFMLTFGFKF